MKTYAGDRCGAEGIAVIRDLCSEISDTKVRIADEAAIFGSRFKVRSGVN